MSRVGDSKAQFLIFNMDVIKGLKQIEADSIDCVVTSPPYWQWSLRDYKIEGQIGLEDHPQKYIDKLVEVFGEVKRVLKPTGSIFLNLGDTYYTKSGTNFGSSDSMKSLDKHNEDKGMEKVNQIRGLYKTNWLQSKQRLLVPHRVAIALQDKLGLILRNDFVWFKPASMPSSVQDRCSNRFEYMFHFVKTPKYFYDLNAIRVPFKEISIRRAETPISSYKYYEQASLEWKGSKIETTGRKMVELNPLGKNPGDVLRFAPSYFSEAHFATFPDELVKFPLNASCPKLVCKKCGHPRVKLYKIEEGHRSEEDELALQKEVKEKGVPRHTLGLKYPTHTKKTFIGWSRCHDDEYEAGLVLDPFLGSGTTLKVAQEMGLRGKGIEINEKYLPLIKARLLGDAKQTSLNVNKIEVIR